MTHDTHPGRQAVSPVEGSSVSCGKETRRVGRREGSLPLPGSSGRLEETRGRAFQAEGMACAEAQRGERATVFSQEEVSEERAGLCSLWAGEQQEMKKQDLECLEGRVLPAPVLWSRHPWPQLLFTC